MSSNVIVAGFIPLLDCAPLMVAAEKGFAAEEGLDLTLVRETSWANIRDRIVVGHFDAAHMLAPMAIASTLGVGHLKVPLVVPLALGFGGNAITVSNVLWRAMIDAGATLGGTPRTQGDALRAVVRSRKEPLTFAMVYPFSAHNYELRYWLAACGIDPDQEVRLVVLPPPLLVDALREGQIDGFCVGEPWSSLAVTVGVGVIAMWTTAIWRHSPEKVLACRLQWAERDPARLDALVRALHRAALWCEVAQHREELARLLAMPRYVGAPIDVLMPGLTQRLQLAPGVEPQVASDFYVSARDHATFPWTSHALWFYSQMVRWKQVPWSEAAARAAAATYRPDLYRRAVKDAPQLDSKVEVDSFFDGRVFDATKLAAYLEEPEPE